MSAEVCAYPDVVKYASKDTEHAHQVALFMWLAHAAWDVNKKQLNSLMASQRQVAINRTYFLHSKRNEYVAFTPVDLPGINECLHAIPNGGARDKITASRLKAEGVKSGVADLFLPMARWRGSSENCTEGVTHGLYIEMKRPRGAKGRRGVASEAQEAWRDIVTANGYAWVLAERWNDALTALWDYLYG